MVAAIFCAMIPDLPTPMNTTFPLHFDRQAHPLHVYGWIQALNGVMICTLELALLSFTRHGSIRGYMATGYAVLASSYLLFFAGSTVAIFTLVMVAFTLGEMLAFSRQSAYIATLIWMKRMASGRVLPRFLSSPGGGAA